MSTIVENEHSTLLNVYPNHGSAEGAIHVLQRAGFPLTKLSILGQDFGTIEKPVGFVTTGSVANDGAKVGAWTGGNPNLPVTNHTWLGRLAQVRNFSGRNAVRLVRNCCCHA